MNKLINIAIFFIIIVLLIPLGLLLKFCWELFLMGWNIL